MSLSDDNFEHESVIVSAWNHDGQDATVGMRGVTAITLASENGQMAKVPWLRVWKGDHLHMRLNVALLLSIEYAPPPDAK